MKSHFAPDSVSTPFEKPLGGPRCSGLMNLNVMSCQQGIRFRDTGQELLTKRRAQAVQRKETASLRRSLKQIGLGKVRLQDRIESCRQLFRKRSEERRVGKEGGCRWWEVSG